ncbi:DUF2332 family protein [Nonomuraea sp. NPDC026600]|uniref:DUF2332 family protein n=1 Tax=Nonomuraea sp. NPDC026600 TaxID=3155363 RepID=UPI0033FBB167
MPIAEQYRRFASMEAHGRSPLYEQLALGVADDRDLIGLLSGLPPAKRQPNLLFAAAARLPQRPPAHTTTNILALDQQPVASTALHGGWLRWLTT